MNSIRINLLIGVVLCFAGALALGWGTVHSTERGRPLDMPPIEGFSGVTASLPMAPILAFLMMASGAVFVATGIRK
jgi:hypothetical protein